MCNRLSRLVHSMQTVARSVLDESVPRKAVLGDNRKNAKRLGRQTNVGTLPKHMATELQAISQFHNLASAVQERGVSMKTLRFFSAFAVVLVFASAVGAIPTSVKSSSSYGQDSNADTWNLDASSPLVYTPSTIALTGLQEVVCPGQDVSGATCSSGDYAFLYQVSSAPANLILTFSGAGLPLSSSDFGILTCDPANGNTIALCTNTTATSFPDIASNNTGGVSFAISGALPTYTTGTNGQGGLTFYLVVDETAGAAVVTPDVTASIATTPEPGSLLLLAIGVCTLAGLRRRSNQMANGW
jgi:hypothetical protein